MKRLLYAAAMVLLMPFAGMASTVTSCDMDNPDVSNAVLNNDACFTFDGFANLDGDIVISGTTLDFIEKDDGAFGGGTDLILTGDSKSGTWAISDAAFALSDYFLLVFKDGTTANPANQVGYVVSEQSGTYTSPFFIETTGETQKDISFTSLFAISGGDITPRSDPPSPVPLPAGVWLLGAGIGALGIARRRKKAA